MSIVRDLLHAAAEHVETRIPRRVSVRDLSRSTSDVLKFLEEENTSALITHRGVPRFMIVPIDSDRISQLILTGSPDLFREFDADGESLVKGRKVTVESPSEQHL